MAGSAGAGADGSGAGSEARERVTSGERSQRASHRRGAGARGAAGQGGAPDAGAGRGGALRLAGGRSHSRRHGEKISSFQNRPQHVNHARDTSTSGTRCDELDQPVAAILKKLNARRHHYHQSPVHDRKEEIVQEPGRVNQPVIARDASEPTDSPPRYLRIVILTNIILLYIILIIIYF